MPDRMTDARKEAVGWSREAARRRQMYEEAVARRAAAWYRCRMAGVPFDRLEEDCGIDRSLIHRTIKSYAQAHRLPVPTGIIRPELEAAS